MNNYATLIPCIQKARQEASGATTAQRNKYVRVSFQNTPAWGQMATSILLRSGSWMTGCYLVFSVTPVVTASGTLAFPDDISTTISQLTLSAGGTTLQQVSGDCIATFNQMNASIQKLAAMEQALGLNLSLTARAALATAAQQFIIELPLPCVDAPMPISQISQDLQLQVTMNPLTGVLQGGGTYTSGGIINNAYLLTEFLVPEENQPDTAITFAARVNRGENILVPYRDPFTSYYNIAGGTTSATVFLSQVRGLCKHLLFYIIQDTDLRSTTYNFNPQNWLPITDLQCTANGQVFPDAPLQAAVARFVLGPDSGMLNVPQLRNCIAFPFDAIDSKEDAPGGVGFLVSSSGFRNYGGPGTQSLNTTLNFPQLPAGNFLLCVYEVQWNALSYSPAPSGQIEVNRLVQ